MCVTTNGLLRLFYQISSRHEETALELESVTAADDLITHASFCCDKRKTPPDSKCVAAELIFLVSKHPSHSSRYGVQAAEGSACWCELGESPK